MNPKKVSIIISAHNEAENITRTLAAVSALTYPDFEIIVVDNASTDGTSEVVRKFGGPVKLLQQPRKGVQFAREMGRQAATGELIAFVDAVCLPSPSWLTRAVADLDEGFVAVSGPYYYYDHGKFFGFASLFFQKVFYKTIHQILQLSHRGGTMVFGNCVVTKEALIKIGGINTKIEFYGDDTDLAKKLTAVGRIYYDTGLVVRRSARRFKNLGTFRTLATYWWFFLKNIFP